MICYESLNFEQKNWLWNSVITMIIYHLCSESIFHGNWLYFSDFVWQNKNQKFWISHFIFVFSLAAYDRPKSFITTWNGNFMEARKNRFTKIENWIISTVVWISYRYTAATSHLKSAIAIHAIEFSCCDLMLTCIFVIIFSIVIIERVRIISQFIFPLQRLNSCIAHCRLI